MAHPRRKTIIAGNWKMNKTRDEAKALVNALVSGLAGQKDLPEILVFPPFTALDAVCGVAAGSPVKVGAQNMDYRDAGAFTGEISPLMLIDLGLNHVLIGHSERRQFFGETNQTVPLKVKAALDKGLTPVICVGELLDERENNLTDPVVKRQVGAAVNGLTSEEVNKVVFAYEPVWAIGTGRVCEAGEAARVAQQIRHTLRQFMPAPYDPENVSVLYGGSVTAANAEEIIGQEPVDGALVGGASLKPDEFLTIVKSAKKVAGITPSAG